MIGGIRGPHAECTVTGAAPGRFRMRLEGQDSTDDCDGDRAEGQGADRAGSELKTKHIRAY